MSEPRKFAPPGPLALDPRAFGMFLLREYTPVTVDRDGVTVLSIRGPLQQFADPFCDSYEWICERVAHAVAGHPRAIVLSIASPGGAVAGCFEASARIRSLCARAGVPLFAYVDGSACSAAYALACSASHIAAPPTAAVGSIGVIGEFLDASRAEKNAGIEVHVLVSGERKSDGGAHAPPTSAARASLQALVDRMAETFFAHVSAARSISIDAVRALDAGTFLGADAQSLALTDSTQTLDELIESINAGSATDTTSEDPMTTKTTATSTAPNATASKADDDKEYEGAIASLRKRAAAGDARAKRMLKAELEEDEETAESQAAEGEGDDGETKKKDDEEEEGEESQGAREAHSATSTAARAESKADAALASAERTERETLLASRPDLDAATRNLLASSSVDAVREFLKTAPRKSLKGLAAASAVVAPTRAAGQVDGGGETIPPDEAHDLDVRMGLVDRPVAIRMEGNRQVLPVYGRGAAREELARRQAAAAKADGAAR